MELSSSNVRCLLSVSHIAATMLATQLNALVTSNAIQRNGVVRLNKYLCNIVSNRRIVIVLGLDVVAADVGYVIGRHSRLGSPSGNPAVLKDDGAVEEAPAVAPVPAPAAAYGAPAPSYPAESVTEFGAPAPYAPVPAAYAAPTYGASVRFSVRSPSAAAAPLANPYSASRARPSTAAPHAASGNPYQPISSLNPYNSRWHIRVRVASRVRCTMTALMSGAHQNVHQRPRFGAALFSQSC